jgi:hypothetical protein
MGQHRLDGDTSALNDRFPALIHGSLIILCLKSSVAVGII